MDAKLLRILHATLEKTESGALEWQSFDPDSFRTRIGSGSLHIQRGSAEGSSDGEHFFPITTYSVQVADNQGRIVAEAEIGERVEGFGVFDRLFLAARKSALRSDHVLDDMLKTLLGGSAA